MSTLVEVQPSAAPWVPPATAPLDPVVWEQWVAKGRSQERAANAMRVRTVKCISAAVLIAVAGLWPYAPPYAVVLRFLVAAGAIVVMLQAFREEHYVAVGIFGALALLYNPVTALFAFSGSWQRAFVAASAVPFVASLAWRSSKRRTTPKMIAAVSKSALTAFLLFAALAATASAEDLSRYRNFQFGTDLDAVTKLTAVNPPRLTDISRRPALIQELGWRPQPLGTSSKPEPVEQMVFQFYNGKLFRIVVTYDRHETEGLTAGDFAEAISASYGVAVKSASSLPPATDSYQEREELIARWEDPQYRYDLILSADKTSFQLVGVSKELEVPAQAAALEAKRLDDLEAPQREAARMVSEQADAKARLEKARLLNKARFRP